MARLLLALLTSTLLLTACAPGAVTAPLTQAPSCPVTPVDSYWHAPVTDLPVHASSGDWIDAIGTDVPVHPDFGSGTFDGGPIGIPYVVVGEEVADVPVTFEFADESDPGPYPIPADPPIEGGPDSDGDRHILIVDGPECVLYELYDARQAGDGAWSAGSGAVFDLTSNVLRPDTWTSADAAGLPILPGLVRFDEASAGEIDHAIRITAPVTDRRHIWPARHDAGARDDTTLPPMGARFRLSSSVDPSSFPEQVQPIVVALQTYGAILADNGSAWFVSGAPDPGWDDDALRSLRQLTGADFVAVDTTGMVVDPSSGQARGATGDGSGEDRVSGRLAGDSRIGTAIAISRAQFPQGAVTVYLARADDPVDAVAGGVLTDGPILLVPSCGTVPSEVVTEIERLDPNRVLALGGAAAICDDLLEQARRA